MNSNRQEKTVAESELSIHRQFSQAVLDSLAANVAVLGKNGTIIAVNKAWAEFATTNSDPIVRFTSVGADVLEVSSQAAEPESEQRQVIDSGIKAVLNGTLPEFTLEYPCQKRWFQVHVTPLAATPQKAAVVMHIDISARKQFEFRAKESEERFRLLLDGVKDYDFLLLDTSGFITTWNSGAECVTGQRANELNGQHVSRLYPAGDVASGKPQRELAEALAKGRIEHEGWPLRSREKIT